MPAMPKTNKCAQPTQFKFWCPIILEKTEMHPTCSISNCVLNMSYVYTKEFLVYTRDLLCMHNTLVHTQKNSLVYTHVSNTTMKTPVLGLTHDTYVIRMYDAGFMRMMHFLYA